MNNVTDAYSASTMLSLIVQNGCSACELVFPGIANGG